MSQKPFSDDKPFVTPSEFSTWLKEVSADEKALNEKMKAGLKRGLESSNGPEKPAEPLAQTTEEG